MHQICNVDGSLDELTAIFRIVLGSDGRRALCAHYSLVLISIHVMWACQK